MNKAVFLLNEAAADKVSSLLRVLLWGSIVLSILFLLTLFVVRKNVQIIFEKLKGSYKEVKSLNRAKDCVIDNLSHELKTPISILDTTLKLLQKRLTGVEIQGKCSQRILARARKNLYRLIEMQEEIGDVLLKEDYRTHYQLSTLLNLCADELEVMVSQGLGEEDIIPQLRERIEEVYGLRKSIPKEIQLGEFVREKIEELRPRFSHRICKVQTRISFTEPVWIPSDVLSKVVEGLVRNAIENTPDESWVKVTVRPVEMVSEFEVKDNGIGITEENQHLILKNYFTAYEPKHYSSHKPYDFNAGGKGFDLARMRVFSERYHFRIQLASLRCCNISKTNDACPGNINDCVHYRKLEEGQRKRGTTVKVQFYPSQKFNEKRLFCNN